MLEVRGFPSGNQIDLIGSIACEVGEDTLEFFVRACFVRPRCEAYQGAVVIQQYEPFRSLSIRGSDVRQRKWRRLLGSVRIAHPGRLVQQLQKTLAPCEYVVAQYTPMQRAHTFTLLV